MQWCDFMLMMMLMMMMMMTMTMTMTIIFRIRLVFDCQVPSAFSDGDCLVERISWQISSHDKVLVNEHSVSTVTLCYSVTEK